MHCKIETIDLNIKIESYEKTTIVYGVLKTYRMYTHSIIDACPPSP